MESVKFDRERGQILVQVAIMVGVLFAFVALALDGGHIYAGRRRMQNAADAGALAGAREICFGNHDSLAAAHDAAEDVAREYAIQRNGADTATVQILDDFTVTVDAQQTLDTFFAGVIGIDSAPVRAEAAAVCGGLRSGAGVWPLAFNYYTFTNEITCGQEFVVFDDTSNMDCADDSFCCDPNNCDDEMCDSGSCGECDCMQDGPHIGPGSYGWLNLDYPGEGYMPENPEPGTCTGGGAGWTECWVRYDYLGDIFAGDCIEGESGVQNSVGVAANSRVSEVLNIVLWDQECEGTGGTYYRVEQFGCIEVIGYVQNYDVLTCGSTEGDNSVCQNGGNHKVIKARKICPDDPGDYGYNQCVSLTGGTPGGGNTSQAKGVSLIQWPPPDDS